MFGKSGRRFTWKMAFKNGLCSCVVYGRLFLFFKFRAVTESLCVWHSGGAQPRHKQDNKDTSIQQCNAGGTESTLRMGVR